MRGRLPLVRLAALAFFWNSVEAVNDQYERHPSLLAARSERPPEANSNMKFPPTRGDHPLPVTTSWVWYFVAPDDLSYGGPIRLLPQEILLEKNFHMPSPIDDPSEDPEYRSMYDKLNWWFPSAAGNTAISVTHQKPRPLLSSQGPNRKVDPVAPTLTKLELKKPIFNDDRRIEGSKYRITPMAMPQGLKLDTSITLKPMHFSSPDPILFEQVFDNIEGDLVGDSLTRTEIIWRLFRRSPELYYSCYIEQQNAWFFTILTATSRHEPSELRDCVKLSEIVFTPVPLSLDVFRETGQGGHAEAERERERQSRFAEYAGHLDLPVDISKDERFYKVLFDKWFADEISGRLNRPTRKIAKTRYNEALKRFLKAHQDGGDPEGLLGHHSELALSRHRAVFKFKSQQEPPKKKGKQQVVNSKANSIASPSVVNDPSSSDPGPEKKVKFNPPNTNIPAQLLQDQQKFPDGQIRDIPDAPPRDWFRHQQQQQEEDAPPQTTEDKARGPGLESLNWGAVFDDINRNIGQSPVQSHALDNVPVHKAFEELDFKSIDFSGFDLDMWMSDTKGLIDKDDTKWWLPQTPPIQHTDSKGSGNAPMLK